MKSKKISLFLSFALILCHFVFFYGHSVLANDSFQYWSGYEFAKELGPKFEIFYNPEFRTRDDARGIFFHFHRFGLKWKPSKYLQTGVNYFIARTQPLRRGQPLYENRLELDLMPKYAFRSFNFSLRARTELRQVQGSSGEEEWRFRLRPQIAYNTKCFGHKIAPYISDEIFYDVERDAWNQNRMTAGIGIPIGKWKGIGTNLDIYYMLQSNRSVRDEWSSDQIFGTKFTVRL